MIRCNNFSSYTYEWVSTPDPIILWENDGVNNLMKRLLNDRVMNDTGWPDHNKKVKRETDLWSNSIVDCICWSNISSPYRHRILDGPTYDGPTYNGPTYEGQAKCFSPRNASRFLNKSAANQLQTALTKRPKNRAWACLHWLPTWKTRMAAVHKVTLPTMRIEPTRSTTSLWCTRLLFLRYALSLQDLLPLFGAQDHSSCGVHWAYKDC